MRILPQMFEFLDEVIFYTPALCTILLYYSLDATKETGVIAAECDPRMTCFACLSM